MIIFHRKKFVCKILNVYHLEDGNPDKLIDFSDYICVSVPELRFNVSRKELLRITRYISQKAVAKNKKVHLIGCTDLKMMKEMKNAISIGWKINIGMIVYLIYHITRL